MYNESVNWRPTGRRCSSSLSKMAPTVADDLSTTGAEATTSIRRQVDPPAILSLSVENTEEARRRCFQSGACDFLLKSADVAEIPRAIRQAAFGKVPSPRLVPALR